MSCCKETDPSANQGQMEPMQPSQVQPPLPTITQPAASHIPMAAPQPRVVHLPPLLLHQNTLKRLAICQLVFAILSLTLGIACVGVAASGIVSSYTGVGIWGSVLAVIAASFGIGAAQAPGKRGLMVTYFTMGLLASVAMLMLLGCSITWSIIEKGALDDYDYDYDNDHWGFFIDKDGYQATYALNIILSLLSLINIILFIISLSLICYNWTSCCCCCNRSENVLEMEAIAGHQPMVVQFQQQPQHQVFASSPQQGMTIVQQQPPPYYSRY